jgi:hypothetical protein
MQPILPVHLRTRYADAKVGVRAPKDRVVHERRVVGHANVGDLRRDIYRGSRRVEDRHGVDGCFPNLDEHGHGRAFPEEEPVVIMRVARIRVELSVVQSPRLDRRCALERVAGVALGIGVVLLDRRM